MASVNIDFGGLDEWRRGEIARHFAQTRHLRYGGLERCDALVFRTTVESVTRTEPEAVLLAQLADAAATGGTVKASRMGRGEAARMSELLRQTADRASREGRDGQVTEVLARLWRDWDTANRVPADEYERAERALYA